MPTSYCIILLIGFVTLNAIFVLGGLLTRYFSVHIIFLTLTATFFYTAVGYAGAYFINSTSGVSLSGLLGLYEAVFGIKILRWLQADIEAYLEELQPMLDERGFFHPFLVLIMVFAYMFIGWMGSLLV